MRLDSRFTSDDVGFKNFYTQKDEIEGVGVLDQNFIIQPRTSNGFSVGGVFEDGKWYKVARDIIYG